MSDARVPKKLRGVLDGGAKAKARFAALGAFLDGAADAGELGAACAAAAGPLAALVGEMHGAALERLGADREYALRFEKALLRGELEEGYARVPQLAGVLVRHGAAHVRAARGACATIAGVLRALIHPANHAVLRRAGLAVLLAWVRDAASCPPEAEALFAEAVPLDAFFVSDSTPASPTAAPIFRGPSDASAKEAALTLLTDVLSLAGADADASREDAARVLGLVRTHCLGPLYAEGRVPPAAVQAVVVRFVAQWAVQPADGSALSPAVFMLQDALLGVPENVALVQAVLSAAMGLGAAHAGVVRGALGVLSAWSVCPAERRPAFAAGDAAVAGHVRTAGRVFTDPRRVQGHVAEQLAVFRDALALLRAVVASPFVAEREVVLSAAREVVLVALERHLCDASSVLASSTLSADWASLVVETALVVWIRSQTLSAEAWAPLADALGRCAHVPSVVAEWARQLSEATDVYFSLAYGALLSSGDGAPGDSYSARVAWVSGALEGAAAARLASAPDESLVARAVAVERSAHVRPSLAAVLAARSVSARAGAEPFLCWHGDAWVASNAEGVWRALLAVFADVGSISDADAHAEATAALVDVTERLLALSAALPHTDSSALLSDLPSASHTDSSMSQTGLSMPKTGLSVPHTDASTLVSDSLCQTESSMLVSDAPSEPRTKSVGQPPVLVAIDALLDACDAEPRAYAASRALAYSAVCRLYFESPGLDARTEAALRARGARVLLALLRVLAERDDAAALVVVVHASGLFACPAAARLLPGHVVLAPAAVKCVAAMLSAPLAGPERAAALVPMMRLVAAVAVLPNALPRMRVPRVEASPSLPVTCAGDAALESLQMQIKDVLAMADYQAHTRGDALVHSALLATVATLLSDLLLSQPEPRETLVDAYLNVLLDHLLPRDGPVLPVVFDALHALAGHVHAKAARLGPEREVMVVQRMVTAVRSAFADVDAPPASQDGLAAAALAALLDWLLALPGDWLAGQHSLREQVFAVLEEALRRPGARDAAEHALVHVAHHVGACAPPLCVGDAPWAARRSVYVALGDAAILCVSAVDSARVRLTVRSSAGRFTWDALSLFGECDGSAATGSSIGGHPTTQSLRQAGSLTIDSSVGGLPTAPSLSGEESIPDGDCPADSQSRDRLSGDRLSGDRLMETLDALAARRAAPEDECGLPRYARDASIDGLLPASAVPDNIGPGASAMARRIADHAAAERLLEREYAAGTGHKAADSSIPSGARPPAFAAARLLLHALGMLAPTVRVASASATHAQGEAGAPLRVLAKSAGLLRDLRLLDARPAFEAVHVALLYVAPGQEDDAAILSNSRGSPAYSAFARALGWLPKEESPAGRRVHRTTTTQVTFAEAVRLAGGADEKTAALGACPVAVAWSEAARPLRPGTLRGDICRVLISVSPVALAPANTGDVAADRLFRVSVLRAAGLPLFGPLLDGALVPGALLGPLVRATAVAGHRAVLAFAAGAAGRPAPLRLAAGVRARDVAAIAERHALAASAARAAWRLEDVVSHVLFAGRGTSLPEEADAPLTTAHPADSFFDQAIADYERAVDAAIPDVCDTEQPFVSPLADIASGMSSVADSSVVDSSASDNSTGDSGAPSRADMLSPELVPLAALALHEPGAAGTKDAPDCGPHSAGADAAPLLQAHGAERSEHAAC